MTGKPAPAGIKNRNLTKVDPAPFRYVMQIVVASGVSVTALALRSGVSRYELTRIWYGQVETIWPSTAEKLRTALVSYLSPREVTP